MTLTQKQQQTIRLLNELTFKHDNSEERLIEMVRYNLDHLHPELWERHDALERQIIRGLASLPESVVEAWRNGELV